MKCTLLAFAALTLLASIGAQAEETSVGAQTKETLKPYTPRAGLWEFELDGPAFPIGQINFFVPTNAPIGTLGIVTAPQRGVSVASTSSSGGGGGATTTFGLTGSFGYCATDLLEIGLGLGLNTISLPNSGGNATGFNAQPFLKLNFGGTLAPDSRINPFILAGTGINYVTASSGSSSSKTDATFVIPEIALGVEMMVTRWWGLSLFVPITMAFDVSSGAQGDVKVIGVGVGYGLAPISTEQRRLAA